MHGGDCFFDRNWFSCRYNINAGNKQHVHKTFYVSAYVKVYMHRYVFAASVSYKYINTTLHTGGEGGNRTRTYRSVADKRKQTGRDRPTRTAFFRRSPRAYLPSRSRSRVAFDAGYYLFYFFDICFISSECTIFTSTNTMTFESTDVYWTEPTE